MRRRILLSGGGIDPITGRGTIGDYEVVDLGLPSGLLWATCNVGATKEEGYGSYYQWGAGAVTYQNTNQYHTGGTDSSYTLPSTADTATVVMGSGWRMPTKDELQDLIDNTNYTWTAINGINGGKFTSRTNPNAYVFFPAAGYGHDDSLYYEGSRSYVWSSTPSNRYNACYLYFYSGYEGVSGNGRFYGFSVRGVY